MARENSPSLFKSKNTQFALIDCNNFYASCERLFRPDLKNTPIIVLSNNDGCVVARSNEAKDLGIKMGAPYFETKALCRQHQVKVFSSNYTLYGDLSERVMSVIQDAWNETEIYSIDEAFLNLTTLPHHQLESFCWDLQRKILQHTGIPTSIGIGSTKTLAKVANHLAKKKLKIPVFSVDEKSAWLSNLDVNDIWGIGFQWTKKLNALGVHTAADLAALDYKIVRQKFNVMLQRTAMELNGVPCLDLEVTEPKQSIMSSCSFGGLQTDYNQIKQAISHHCATAWDKMRRQGLIAQQLSVFLRSNPFRNDLKQYSNMIGFRIVNPTDDIRALTRYAKFCLSKIFKEGIHYHKSGVLLAELIDKKYRQMDLFNQPRDDSLQHSDKIMDTFELINKKFGPRTLRLAAEGFNKGWSMQRQLKSPNYTTQWTELPIAHMK